MFNKIILVFFFHFNLESDGDFRKSQNTALKTKEVIQFVQSKVAESVGCIIIDLKDDGQYIGTGFAVGKKYVMTAYHVFARSIGM